MSYFLTLAEVESYLRKSAQAVGLDWGIAEEAGKHKDTKIHLHPTG